MQEEYSLLPIVFMCMKSKGCCTSVVSVVLLYIGIEKRLYTGAFTNALHAFTLETNSHLCTMS